MRSLLILVAAVFFGGASIVPCGAQTLQGDAAYQELLRLSEPSGIVVIGGKRYLLAPQGGAFLPGGYNVFYDRIKVRLPNGQEVEVIDPAKPLTISKGGKPSEPSTAEPDRVRRIVAALEKIGLHPKVEHVPQAVGGYRIEIVTGDIKPGGTLTQMYIHVGVESKVRQLYDASKKFLSDNTYEMAKKRHQPYVVEHFIPFEIASFAPARLWTGVIWYPINSDDSQKGGSEVDIGTASYLLGSVRADCIKDDVVLTVAMRRYDTSPNPYKLALMIDDADRRRTRGRSVELAAIVRPQAENWMKVLAKLVDDADKASVPATATAPAATTAKQPEPKLPQPPPAQPTASAATPAAAQPPAAPQLTAGELALLRNVLKSGRGVRSIIPLGLQDTAKNLKDTAIAHPWQTLGAAIAGLGVIGVGVGSLPVWAGLGVLSSAGIIATFGPYYSNKPKETPTELAVIRDVRAKIGKYQKDWKRDFTDAELNELGIVMNDLSALTREQRAEVYKDAGIEFQSRAEAFIALREELRDEERRKAGR